MLKYYRRSNPMKKSQYSSEQIVFALRQAESGTPVTEVCRKMGIAEQTFYRWKKKYIGMGVAEVRRLKILEEENRQLKQLVADLSLDKQMLQDVLQKKSKACSVPRIWGVAADVLRGKWTEGMPGTSAVFLGLPL
jgi:putative transposase